MNAHSAEDEGLGDEELPDKEGADFQGSVRQASRRRDQMAKPLKRRKRLKLTIQPGIERQEDSKEVLAHAKRARSELEAQLGSLSSIEKESEAWDRIEVITRAELRAIFEGSQQDWQDILLETHPEVRKFLRGLR